MDGVVESVRCWQTSGVSSRISAHRRRTCERNTDVPNGFSRSFVALSDKRPAGATRYATELHRQWLFRIRRQRRIKVKQLAKSIRALNCVAKSERGVILCAGGRCVIAKASLAEPVLPNERMGPRFGSAYREAVTGGVYVSAVEVGCGQYLYPPTINTVPSGSSVAVCMWRPATIVPAGTTLPVAGR